MYLVCRLLLEGSGAHPALPSFPTRRSSDLSSAESRKRTTKEGAATVEVLLTVATTCTVCPERTGVPTLSETRRRSANLAGLASGVTVTVWEIGRAHV